jgi:hypothetical protein
LAGPCLWLPLLSTPPCGPPTKMKITPKSEYRSKRTCRLTFNCLLSLILPCRNKGLTAPPFLQVFQSVEWVE